jgi:RNA polymerase sigma-70 factor (ECF subfamily)
MAKSLFSTLFAISDEQAMWRVQQQDDHAAFAQLVERWQLPIRNLCMRMTGDAHRGEDVAQEAFTRVFARRKDWRPEGKFSTWLWRIALNLCYDELRRIQRRAESPLEAGDDTEDSPFIRLPAGEAPAPDSELARQEQGELVRQTLARLPEIYRTVLVLRHYEDLKFREIAEVLDIPEGTVKSRMAEALAQMSQLLKPALEDKIRTAEQCAQPITNH